MAYLRTGGMAIKADTVTSGLHDQWLQWDTRNVDYTGMLLLNEVGSSVWTLPVTATGTPLTYRAARAASSSPSVTWADIGGDPDVGPFTLMFKAGAIIEDSGPSSGGGSLRILLTGASNRRIDLRLEALWDEGEGFEYRGVQRGLLRANLSVPNIENEIVVTQDQSTLPTTITENMLITIVTDPMGVDFHVFYGLTEITTTVNDLVYTSTIDGDISANLLANLAQPFSTTSATFGAHSNFTGTLVQGDPWASVVGAVGFRGSPTTSDLVFWNAYFTP